MVQLLSPISVGCVTSGKLPNLCEPCFPHLVKWELPESHFYKDSWGGSWCINKRSSITRIIKKKPHMAHSRCFRAVSYFLLFTYISSDCFTAIFQSPQLLFCSRYPGRLCPQHSTAGLRLCALAYVRTLSPWIRTHPNDVILTDIS